MITIYEYPHLQTSLPDYNGDYPVEAGAYPLGTLSGIETLIWKRRYQNAGEFSLKIPFSEAAAEKLVCGNLIGITGRSEELCRITYTAYDEDERGVEYIEVKGKSLLSIVNKRVMRSSGTYYSTIRAIISQYIMPYYGSSDVNNLILNQFDVTGDVADDNYGDRRFPRLYWREPTFDDGTTEAEGGFINFSWEALANTLTTLISACRAGNCGARIVTERMTDISDNYALYFQLYRGINRSANQSAVTPIIFSRSIGNVAKRSYVHDIEGVKTAGYITNQHIDSLSASSMRLVDIMSGNNYSTTNPANVNGGSGMNRSELGMTVSTLAIPTTGTSTEKINALYASCKEIGKAEIAKSGEEHTLKLTIDQNAAWPKYRTDYDLGDIVTFRDAAYGVAMDAPVTETTETYEAGKNMKLDIVVGTGTTTMLDNVRKVAQRRG